LFNHLRPNPTENQPADEACAERDGQAKIRLILSGCDGTLKIEQDSFLYVTVQRQF
jgi:hypothetical protein